MTSEDLVAKRYIVERDDEQHRWKIYDALHPDLATGGAEEDIPDDHPAIKILNEREWIELVNEATRLGLLEAKLSQDTTAAVEKESSMTEKDNTKLELNMKKNTQQLDTESVQLKKYGIDAIVRLIGIHDLTELTK